MYRLSPFCGANRAIFFAAAPSFLCRGRGRCSRARARKNNKMTEVLQFSARKRSTSLKGNAAVEINHHASSTTPSRKRTLLSTVEIAKDCPEPSKAPKVASRLDAAAVYVDWTHLMETLSLAIVPPTLLGRQGERQKVHAFLGTPCASEPDVATQNPVFFHS